MQIVKLSNDINFYEEILKLGSDKRGVKIMSAKASMLYLKFYDLDIRAANILKQEALSIGSDLAVGANCAAMSGKVTDAILITDKKRIDILINKLQEQPFGLKKVANELKNFVFKNNENITLMGILNINEDSFYSKSRVCENEFLKSATKLFEDGADILDVGAVSSRPGSTYCGEDEEFRRIKPIVDLLYSEKLCAKISIDTFSPKVIEYALDCGVAIINDISGLENLQIAKLVAKYSAKLVIMHKLGDTATMQDSPEYKNVVCEVDEFLKQKIEIANSLGVKDIILDYGIGFGKSLKHNLELIKSTSHFLKYGYEVLVGASRKSMIDKISQSKIEDRLSGTLTIHLKALDEGATIIRAHDVYEHRQAIDVWKALKKAV